MSLESGSVSFMPYSLESENFYTDNNLAVLISENAFPADINKVGRERISGFNTLKGDAAEESGVIFEEQIWLDSSDGEIAVFTFDAAQRKPPAETLRAEINAEFRRYMHDTNTTYLRRETRKEIVAEVTKNMTLDSVPTLTRTGICIIPHRKLAFICTTSQHTADEIVRHLGMLLRIKLTPITAASLMKDHGVDPYDLTPSAFCGLPAETLFLLTELEDFLTWLYYHPYHTCDLIAGCFPPFTFKNLDSTVKCGEEGAAAILKHIYRAGLKLIAAPIAMDSGGDAISSLTFDAAKFLFKAAPPKQDTISLTRPEGLTGRISNICEMWDSFNTLLKAFLEVRADQAQWSAAVDEINKYIGE